MELGQCISRSCEIRGTSKAPADLEPKSDGKHNPRSDINAPAAGNADRGPQKDKQSLMRVEVDLQVFAMISRQNLLKDVANPAAGKGTFL